MGLSAPHPSAKPKALIKGGFTNVGHDARIIPSKFVTAYVQSNTSDTIDAEAIAEAVTRPMMRFEQVRSDDQVDLQALYRIRDRLARNRTSFMNQLRAFCVEYGLAMRTGDDGFYADIRRHLANEARDLSRAVRTLLTSLLVDLDHLERRIAALSKAIDSFAHSDQTIKRLLTIPGFDPLGAIALVAAAGDGDGKQFRRRETWQRVLASFWLTIHRAVNKTCSVSANAATDM